MLCVMCHAEGEILCIPNNTQEQLAAATALFQGMGTIVFWIVCWCGVSFAHANAWGLFCLVRACA